MSVIYEDCEVRVVWLPGESDFLLITFSDLIGVDRGEDFFARAPAEKAKTTTVGIIAKKANWYPRDSLRAVAGVLDGYVGESVRRVVYGGSMGGYAAIKHSKLLRASCVMALCPQWSIDPEEGGGHDLGWSRHFLPEMRGMAIRSDDMAGNIFLFSDPFDPMDRHHAKMIQSENPSVCLVPVPAVGHHVTLVFAGTQNLQDLISACTSKDEVKLNRLSRVMRKNHRVRKAGVLQLAIARHPAVGFELLDQIARQSPDVLRFSPELLPALLGYFLQKGWLNRAVLAYEALSVFSESPLRQLLLGIQVALGTKKQLVLKTCHGTVVCFDILKGRCVHVHDPLAAGLLPVHVEWNSGRVVLFVEASGSRLLLWPGHQNRLTADAPPGGGVYTQGGTISALPDSGFALAYGEMPLYLSAVQASGEVLTGSKQIRHWEKFRFGLL